MAAVLGGIAGRSLIVGQSKQVLLPLEALPLGDSRDAFCYGRFPVDVSVNTDDADTDRVVLPCMMSMLRLKRDFLTTIVIATQSDLVNVEVNPQRSNEKGLAWHDVSWKASSMGMSIRLPRGFDLTVRMHEKDFPQSLESGRILAQSRAQLAHRGRTRSSYTRHNWQNFSTLILQARMPSHQRS